MEYRSKCFVKFNPHPKGISTTDCVVRACCIAFDKDYLETRRELNKAKHELGYSSYKDRKFLYDYLKNYERLKFKAISGQPREKLYEFANAHPTGTYVVSVRGHATCVKDGKLLGTWDCGYLTVYSAWRIK